MTPTSDERREVAARLRDYAKFRNFCPFESFFVRLNMILFGDNGWDRADGYVFEHLADLIDPTCHRERKRVVVDDYRRDTLILPVCSACGFTFDKRMPKPNFCPHCGARLVERGER